MDQMQGAWVEDGFECDQTFKVTGNTIEHREQGSSRDTGIIIRGSKIEGPDAICTAEQIKQEGDNVLTVLLSCSSHIMSGKVATSFRLLGDGHFEHFENAFPEIAVSYRRCHQ